MCITFFFINREPNAQIKFAMVHNREENFARPTAPLGQFEEDKNIFGGRDLKEKGSWLAFNAQTQNFAFLTNRFNWSSLKDRILERFGIGKFGGEISRGQLIKSAVSSDFEGHYPTSGESLGISAFCSAVFSNRNKFSPYNLLVGNLKQMEFIFQSNIDKFPPISLRDGFHSFCNHNSFETPSPKEIYGLGRFKELINKSQNQPEDDNGQPIILSAEQQKQVDLSLVKDIHELMEDKSRHLSAHFLPIPQESSLFILPYWSYLFSHTRGTRTSTVLLLNRNNELIISETTYPEKGLEEESKNQKFQLML